MKKKTRHVVGRKRGSVKNFQRSGQTQGRKSPDAFMWFHRGKSEYCKTAEGRKEGAKEGGERPKERKFFIPIIPRTGVSQKKVKGGGGQKC